MKKALKILSVAALVFIILASYTFALVPYEMEKYGQRTFTAYSTKTKPVTDGIIGEGEYGDPVAVFNYGDPGTYWNGYEYDEATLKELIPKDVKFYLTYDNNNLYLGVTCIDKSHMTPLPGTGVWDGDYLEFDILLCKDDFDYANKVRFALGVNNDGDMTGYYAAVPDYAYPAYALNEEIKDTSYCNATHKGDLTTYEACLPWSEILGTDGPPEKALFYFQLGCSSEELYTDSDYTAFLGVFRTATRLTDEQIAEIEAAGGTGSIVYPIVIFAGERPVPEPVVETAEEPVVIADTSVKQVTAAQTSDAGMIAVITAVFSLAGYLARKKK